MAVIVSIMLPGKLWAKEDAPRAIAAKVNGHVITQNQVAMLLTPRLAELLERFPDRGTEFEKLLAEARKNLLQELIDRRMLIDQFNKPEVQITPVVLEAEMQREIRDNYHGNSDEFREALKMNRITLEGFRSLIRDRLIEKELRKRQKK